MNIDRRLAASSTRILKEGKGRRSSFRPSMIKHRRLEGPSYVAIEETKMDKFKKFLKTVCICCDNNWFQPKGYRPMYQTDVFYYGSVYRFMKSKSYQKPDTAIRYSMRVSKVPTVKDVEQGTCGAWCPESIKRTISNMLDIKVFKYKAFVIYVISTLAFYTVSVGPMLYINSFAFQKLGSLQYLEYLIPTMGCGVFVGRLGGGVLLYLVPEISALALCTGLGVLVSTATLAVTENTYLLLFFAYCFVYGIVFGLYSSLRSLILVDYLGLSNLTSASGILFAFSGVAYLVGPPIIATLLEFLQTTFIFVFYWTGSLLAISTLALVPLFFIPKAEVDA